MVALSSSRKNWLIDTIFVIAVIVIGGAYALSQIYSTYSYRYRLTVSIGLDGEFHTGSTVIEVSWVGQPEIFGRFESRVKGQAAYIDIGRRGVVLAVLSAPDANEHGIIKWPYGVSARFLGARAFGNGSTHAELPALPALRGRRELASDNMPALIWFSDISDPKTARRIKWSELQSTLGADTKVTANVEITRDPIIIDLDHKLPWYANLAKRQKEHGVVSRPGQFALTSTTLIATDR